MTQCSIIEINKDKKKEYILLSKPLGNDMVLNMCYWYFTDNQFSGNRGNINPKTCFSFGTELILTILGEIADNKDGFLASNTQSAVSLLVDMYKALVLQDNIEYQFKWEEV